MRRVKIICFEDNAADREKVKRAFAGRGNVQFYHDPVKDWPITPERAAEVAKFKPDLIIVDLRDDSNNEPTAGFRTMRQLRDNPATKRFRIAAWSVLFSDTPEGKRLGERAAVYGAVPLRKVGRRQLEPEMFLSAAGLS